MAPAIPARKKSAIPHPVLSVIVPLVLATQLAIAIMPPWIAPATITIPVPSTTNVATAPAPEHPCSATILGTSAKATLAPVSVGPALIPISMVSLVMT
jgi:hypothetical protein